MSAIETDPIAVLASLHKRHPIYTHVEGNTNALFSLLASIEQPMALQDLLRGAKIHRAYGSFVLNTLDEMELVEAQPRPVNGRYYKAWQAREGLVEVCENYNARLADELRCAIPPEQLTQKATTTSLINVALENFANAYKAQLQPSDHDITAWAQRKLKLHPEQTTRVALGALANIYLFDVNARFVELTRAHIAPQAEAPRVPRPRTEPDPLPGAHPALQSAEA